jgi:hypothetical protein
LYSTDIPCTGSPLASTTSLSALFAAGTVFASTRLTESFANAFATRAAGDDTGTRFLVGYSGFPANTHVYIPDMVAGSTALVPSIGGDLGGQRDGGSVRSRQRHIAAGARPVHRCHRGRRSSRFRCPRASAPCCSIP